MPPIERVPWHKGLLWTCVFAPTLLFYSLLTLGYVDIPNADDYPAVLDFANHYVQLNSFGSKIAQVITFQQSEYKTMLVSGVTALQCEFLHRVSLTMLILMGNLMPIGIFAVVLSMYRRTRSDLLKELLLLLPISLLLFQLQYSVTLDWATAGMQNLPIILCSLLAIQFLARSSGTRTFATACIWLVLAICSSANGFGLSIVGAVLLLQQRRWRHLVVWGAVTAAMGSVYFYKYNFHSSQSVPGATIAEASLHFNLLYAISFLGTSVAGYTSVVPSVALGLLVLGAFIYICTSSYARINAAIFYSMLLIIMSAFGVAGLRGALGVGQSLASRYRIYSNLMLVLLFIYAAEMVLPRAKLKPAAEKLTLAAFAFLCLLFCLASDWAGVRFIQGRRLLLITEMSRWEHPDRAATADVDAANPALRRQIQLGLYKPITPTLKESIRMHTYAPRPY